MLRRECSFFKRRGSDKPKVIVMMTKEGSTKFVNFMTLGAEVPELGCGHICNIVKMNYFLNKKKLSLFGNYKYNCLCSYLILLQPT